MEHIDDNLYQTPAEICKYMVSMIPKDSITILEPTAGSGNLVSAIKNLGFNNVTAPHNFFDLDISTKRFDCVVMNPPFAEKYTYGVPEGFNCPGMRMGYYILKKCMEMSDHVIALMPWFTISDSDVRLRYLKNFGIKSLTALPRKTFKYIRIQTMILELEKNFKGETIFKTFDY